jgi:methanogenic corrinoid protein MtbC1
MSDLDDYLAALSAADAAEAVGVLDRAQARGVPAQRLILDVVAPAQQQVGQRWFEGSWSVADEHAATAVSEQAVALLCPPLTGRPDVPRVVMACAEGEWHTLPARLAAELTRISQAEVLFLGASLPADHLRQHLAASGADALALSCTMPTNLIAAARSIAAAHEVGVPVVVGGRAWGVGDFRARRLGADARLDDAAQLVALLDVLQPGVQPSPELPGEALLLDAPADELVLLALERQTAANAWMRGMTAFQQARTKEDLRWLARHAAAAVACDDPTIVRDLLDWLHALLTPRGVPAAAVLDSCFFLADAVEPDAPLAASVLRAEGAAAQTRVAS